MSLLDAFDLGLATATAGLPHQAAAARLAELTFVRENPYTLWLYHLHALIRSTLRTADDATDDRWTDADRQAAAERALTALGQQWRAAPGPSRRLLVGCLRQGLALARDHRLSLGWLTDAAYAYTDDYVWEPLPRPAVAAPKPPPPASWDAWPAIPMHWTTNPSARCRNGLPPPACAGYSSPPASCRHAMRISPSSPTGSHEPLPKSQRGTPISFVRSPGGTSSATLADAQPAAVTPTPRTRATAATSLPPSTS
ncbi:hypothetical protein [Streptomyces sp. NPDC056304]|uniref:hypothetical protein n=1 Tax=Streptomyces sp. NPDC056304 TaxID=3345778 RepID=UPI0035D5FF8A